MPTISSLDKTEGALRLLLTLYKTIKPLNTTELQKKMNELYSVKKHATGTAIQVCADLGLIKIEQGEKKPMPPSYHSLTEKGQEIAAELVKLEKMLEHDYGK